MKLGFVSCLNGLKAQIEVAVSVKPSRGIPSAIILAAASPRRAFASLIFSIETFMSFLR